MGCCFSVSIYCYFTQWAKNGKKCKEICKKQIKTLTLDFWGIILRQAEDSKDSTFFYFSPLYVNQLLWHIGQFLFCLFCFEFHRSFNLLLQLLCPEPALSGAREKFLVMKWKICMWSRWTSLITKHEDYVVTKVAARLKILPRTTKTSKYLHTNLIQFFMKLISDKSAANQKISVSFWLLSW